MSWSERALAGETESIECRGPVSVRKVLDGFGNFDEIQIPLPSGAYVGSTLRLFNPATQLWTIYWMDSRNPWLDAPMIGKFSDSELDHVFHAQLITRYVRRPCRCRAIPARIVM